MGTTLSANLTDALDAQCLNRTAQIDPTIATGVSYSFPFVVFTYSALVYFVVYGVSHRQKCGSETARFELLEVVGASALYTAILSGLDALDDVIIDVELINQGISEDDLLLVLFLQLLSKLLKPVSLDLAITLDFGTTVFMITKSDKILFGLLVFKAVIDLVATVGTWATIPWIRQLYDADYDPEPEISYERRKWYERNGEKYNPQDHIQFGDETRVIAPLAMKGVTSLMFLAFAPLVVSNQFENGNTFVAAWFIVGVLTVGVINVLVLLPLLFSYYGTLVIPKLFCLDAVSLVLIQSYSLFFVLIILGGAIGGILLVVATALIAYDSAFG